MSISEKAIIERDQRVFKLAYNNHIPIVIVPSGGYTQESAHIIAKSIENVLNKSNITFKKLTTMQWIAKCIKMNKLICVGIIGCIALLYARYHSHLNFCTNKQI